MLNATAVNQETATSQGIVELPPELVAEGNPTFESFLSTEFPAEGKFRTGIWVGQPGKMKITGYPSDEVFTRDRGPDRYDQ